jgi:hypothetical protein
MKQFFSTLFLIGMILAGWGIPPGWGEREFHGADSVFEKEGITILWAILKGPNEESSWVHIKIINSGENPFRIFSVEAVDPFSKEKEWVVKGEELKRENSVRSIRSSFREKTSRRILFYRSRQAFEKENPDMSVYYLGVPDTSPEVLSEREMGDYFKKAQERLKK